MTVDIVNQLLEWTITKSVNSRHEKSLMIGFQCDGRTVRSSPFFKLILFVFSILKPIMGLIWN